MKYKELIELYKNGRLSEEERKKIEEDIEKQEAISEYLYPDEEINEKIPEDESEGNISEKDNEFMRLIRKSIRKAFIKMGMAVTAAVLVVIVLMMTIMPKAIDLFYYNPSTSEISFMASRESFAKSSNSIPVFSIAHIASRLAPAANLVSPILLTIDLTFTLAIFLSGYTSVIALIKPVIGSPE